MKQKKIPSKVFVYLVFFVVMACNLHAAQPAVNLGTAGNFVILSESGITDVPTSGITGNIGASPITGAAIGVTCAEVTGSIYDNDGGYTGGGGGSTLCRTTDAGLLTTAVNNMQAAYTDAATRTPADLTGLGSGDISGMTLTPGLYKWSSGLLINTGTSPDTNGVTLDCQGNSNAVFIFQIAGTLTVGSGAVVTLSGGCQASNIFWQVAGSTTLGTTSIFNGNILDQTNIALQTGATLCGKAFAQTAVTLDSNTIATTCGGINPTTSTTLPPGTTSTTIPATTTTTIPPTTTTQHTTTTNNPTTTTQPTTTTTRLVTTTTAIHPTTTTCPHTTTTRPATTTTRPSTTTTVKPTTTTCRWTTTTCPRTTTTRQTTTTTTIRPTTTTVKPTTTTCSHTTTTASTTTTIGGCTVKCWSIYYPYPFMNRYPPSKFCRCV